MERSIRLPIVVAIIGILGSIVAFVLADRSEDRRISSEFERRSSAVSNHLRDALQVQEQALYAARELFHYSSDVTRSEFEGIATALRARYPAFESFLWIPRVTIAARGEMERSAQHESYRDFTFSDAAPDGALQPAAARDEYFPVFFRAPILAGRLPTGFDLRNSPAWPEFEAAAQHDRVSASGRLAPITQSNDEYLIELPVYGLSVPTQPEERRERLRGYVAGVFSPTAVLDQLFIRTNGVGLDALIVERTSTPSADPLYFRASSSTKIANPSPEVFAASGFSQNTAISFGGRVWEFWTRPSADWLAEQRTHQKWIVSGAGLLCTCVLTLLLYSAARRTALVEALVARRTAELHTAHRELREDIRRRSETERALKASEERYRTLVSQSSDAIWRLELPQPIPISLGSEEQIERILNTGRIAECNDITALRFGRSRSGDVLGKSLLDLEANSAVIEHLIRAFIQEDYRLCDYEFEEPSPAGDKRVFSDHLIGVVDDERLTRIWVTERELTQQRLLEQERLNFERQLEGTQRLESLGVLAGGIAHDFNNLLTGILGHTSLARSEYAGEPSLKLHLDEIERGARSAAGLCQQMLAYAGKGRFTVKPHSLSALISENAHLLRISVSKQAELRFQLADDLPPVLADGTQLQQIVMNLVINASEAIGDRSGLITITTGLIRPDAITFTDCPFPPEQRSTSYVYLEVRDSGCGMTQEVKKRIFEPFFTTKFSGRGLGLAAALGIVRSHHGTLRVESASGQGSTFTIFLPASETEPAQPDHPTPSRTPWTAGGTILIIDDEPPVRRVAERMARSLGFSALSAVDGQHGIDLFRQYQSGISLVLLDVTMPGLSGTETVRELRALAPKLPIILMSGYNQPETTEQTIAPSVVFLSKPFNLTEYQSAVRRALNEQKTTTQSGS